MRSVKLLPALIFAALLVACGSSAKKGPPPEATAVPAGTAIAVTATAVTSTTPIGATPTPQIGGAFTKAGTANVPGLQGLAFQTGGTGLLAYSRGDVELIAGTGKQTSVLTVPDPQAVLSVSNTGFVAVKQAGTAVQVQNVRTKAAPKVIDPGLQFGTAVLSNDGSLLAFPEQDKIATLIWDVEENSKLKELTGFTTAAPVYSVRFGPDGRSVIWISRAKVQVEDIAAGALSQAFSHEDFVTGLALSSDRATLITGAGNKVTIWDTASGQSRSTLTMPGTVFDVSLAPDNKTAAVGTQQGVRVIDITTSKDVTTLPGVAREVAFSDDGRQLAVADDQGAITLYKVGP